MTYGTADSRSIAGPAVSPAAGGRAGRRPAGPASIDAVRTNEACDTGLNCTGKRCADKPSERGGQRVDGVVRPRHRRMPALVLRGEREGHVGFLGGLHPERHAARRATFNAAGVAVERVVGGPQPWPLPRAATGCPPVASVSSSQVSTMMTSRDGHEALALPAHHVGHQHRGARLVVERAAADEPAVLLAQHVTGRTASPRASRRRRRGGPAAGRPSAPGLAAEGGDDVRRRRRSARSSRRPPAGNPPPPAAPPPPVPRRHAAAIGRRVDLHQLAEDLPVLLIERGRRVLGTIAAAGISSAPRTHATLRTRVIARTSVRASSFEHCRPAVDQNVARVFRGEPVPPVTGTGAMVSMNSQRFSLAAVSARLRDPDCRAG